MGCTNSKLRVVPQQAVEEWASSNGGRKLWKTSSRRQRRKCNLRDEVKSGSKIQARSSSSKRDTSIKKSTIIAVQESTNSGGSFSLCPSNGSGTSSRVGTASSRVGTASSRVGTASTQMRKSTITRIGTASTCTRFSYKSTQFGSPSSIRTRMSARSYDSGFSEEYFRTIGIMSSGSPLQRQKGAEPLSPLGMLPPDFERKLRSPPNSVYNRRLPPIIMPEYSSSQAVLAEPPVHKHIDRGNVLLNSLPDTPNIMKRPCSRGGIAFDIMMDDMDAKAVSKKKKMPPRLKHLEEIRAEPVNISTGKILLKSLPDSPSIIKRPCSRGGVAFDIMGAEVSKKKPAHLKQLEGKSEPTITLRDLLKKQREAQMRREEFELMKLERIQIQKEKDKQVAETLSNFSAMKKNLKAEAEEKMKTTSKNREAHLQAVRDRLKEKSNKVEELRFKIRPHLKQLEEVRAEPVNVSTGKSLLESLPDSPGIIKRPCSRGGVAFDIIGTEASKKKPAHLKQLEEKAEPTVTLHDLLKKQKEAQMRREGFELMKRERIQIQKEKDRHIAEALANFSVMKMNLKVEAEEKMKTTSKNREAHLQAVRDRLKEKSDKVEELKFKMRPHLKRLEEKRAEPVIISTGKNLLKGLPDSPSIIKRPCSRGGVAFDIMDDEGAEASMKKPAHLKQLEEKPEPTITLCDLLKKQREAQTRREEFELMKLERIQIQKEKDRQVAETLANFSAMTKNLKVEAEGKMRTTSKNREAHLQAIRDRLKEKSNKAEELRFKMQPHLKQYEEMQAEPVNISTGKELLESLPDSPGIIKRPCSRGGVAFDIMGAEASKKKPAHLKQLEEKPEPAITLSDLLQKQREAQMRREGIELMKLERIQIQKEKDRQVAEALANFSAMKKNLKIEAEEKMKTTSKNREAHLQVVRDRLKEKSDKVEELRNARRTHRLPPLWCPIKRQSNEEMPVNLGAN